MKILYIPIKCQKNFTLYAHSAICRQCWKPTYTRACTHPSLHTGSTLVNLILLPNFGSVMGKWCFSANEKWKQSSWGKGPWKDFLCFLKGAWDWNFLTPARLYQYSHSESFELSNGTLGIIRMGRLLRKAKRIRGKLN